jgi:hypothetical protein
MLDRRAQFRSQSTLEVRTLSSNLFSMNPMGLFGGRVVSESPGDPA